MSKETEAIELLESAKKAHNDDCILCACKDRRIDQALTKLREVPEPDLWFVEDYLKKALNRWDIDGKDWVEKALKEIKEQTPEQPPASEFTKEVRENFAEYKDNPDWAIQEKLMEACAKLDTSEAENKQLKADEDELAFQLGTLKDTLKSYQNTSRLHTDFIKETDKIIKKLKAKLNSSEAARKKLVKVCENALISLAIISMPRKDNNVATDAEILKIMGDSFRAVLAKEKEGKENDKRHP